MDARVKVPSLTRHFAGTTVFLVEDSAIIRERLFQMLEALPNVKVIGYAETPTEAIEQIGISRPDVVILDIKLNGGSGITVLRVIKQQMPDVIVVMLTNYTSGQFRSQCMQAGADYFLDKTNEFQNIAFILAQHNFTHAQ